MRPKSLGHSLTGLIIIIVGTGFLLDSLDVWNFGTILRDWWPLIIVAIGLASLTSNTKRPIGPAIITGIGILLLLKSTGMVTFNVWQLIWPVSLIFIGAGLLFHRNHAPQSDQEKVVDLFAAFSGSSTINASSDFRGGRLTAMFGGIELDLRKAKLQQNSSIDVFVAFGGVEVKVPEGWRVTSRGLPVFGGWEVRTANSADEKAPTLELRGSCIFGGVEIHN